MLLVASCTMSFGQLHTVALIEDVVAPSGHGTQLLSGLIYDPTGHPLHDWPLALQIGVSAGQTTSVSVP